MQPRIISLRPASLAKISRLRKEAERDGAYRVAKRLHAVILCVAGRTSGDIAGVLHAPRSKVSEWLRRYEMHGVEGLLEGHRTGRPSDLSADERTQLFDIIDSGPVSYGFPGGVWTSPMVARVIEQEFGHAYHPGHVRKMLHDLGFSVQRPKRLLARANPDLLDRWRRFTYPSLKKKPKPGTRPSSSKTKRASGKTQRFIKRGRVSGTSR